MKKGEAARIAAAEFSDNSKSAAHRYIDLTGQKFDTWQDALEEIKSLIPAYRWPVADCFTETMIFFDPALKNLTCNAICVVSTPAMQKAEECGDTETFKELYQNQVALVEVRRERDKKSEAEAYLEHAERAYKNTSGDSKKRNSAVVRNLNLSSGTKPPTYDVNKMYRDYFELVRKKGLSRYDALEIITDNYGLLSNTATLKYLVSKMKSLKDAVNSALAERGDETIIGTEIRDNILKYLKGFILDGWTLKEIEDSYS